MPVPSDIGWQYTFGKKETLARPGDGKSVLTIAIELQNNFCQRRFQHVKNVSVTDLNNIYSDGSHGS